MQTLSEQLDEAKNCIETMKRIGTFHNHKIGIVKKEFGGFCLLYKEGIIVIYRNDGDTITTEISYSKEGIEKNLKTNNLNTTHSTCVCVPKDRVELFTSKFEKIFK